jgi:hypothetical protein
MNADANGRLSAGKAMPLTDAILDASYAMCEEFGPEGRIPREERLKQKFPQLSAGELQELLRRVNEVNKTVWSLAERGGGIKMQERVVIAELQRNHPFLRHEGLARAVFLPLTTYRPVCSIAWV